MFADLSFLNSTSRNKLLKSQSQSVHSQVPTSQSQSVMAHQEPPRPEEVDVLKRMPLESVYKVIENPPEPDDDDEQQYIELRDKVNVPVLADSLIDKESDDPKAVLLNVYNLNADFVKANDLLSQVSFGGAFHSGVEFLSIEWSYGVYGVCADVPRASAVHVYQCSIFMGKTTMDEKTFAATVHELAQVWSGADYDLFGQNCCAFANTLCQKLGVGSLPTWVDRFPRILNTGRVYGQEAIAGAKVVGKQAVEVGVLATEGAIVVGTHAMEGAKVVGVQAVEGAKVVGAEAKVVGAQAVESAKVVGAQAMEGAKVVGVQAMEVGSLLGEQAIVAGNIARRKTIQFAEEFPEMARPHVDHATEVVQEQASAAVMVVRRESLRFAEEFPGRAQATVELASRIGKESLHGAQDIYSTVQPHFQNMADEAGSKVADFLESSWGFLNSSLLTYEEDDDSSNDSSDEEN